MAKKILKKAISADIGKGINTLISIPVVQQKPPQRRKATLADLGQERATFIVDIDLHDQVRCISYWERIKIKDIVDEALREYVNKHKSTKGKIKEIPKETGESPANK